MFLLYVCYAIQWLELAVHKLHLISLTCQLNIQKKTNQQIHIIIFHRYKMVSFLYIKIILFVYFYARLVLPRRPQSIQISYWGNVPARCCLAIIRQIFRMFSLSNLYSVHRVTDDYTAMRLSHPMYAIKPCVRILVANHLVVCSCCLFPSTKID